MNAEGVEVVDLVGGDELARNNRRNRGERGRLPDWREPQKCSTSFAASSSAVKPMYNFPTPLRDASLGYGGATIGSPFRHEG
jgi:hypothetical protein